MSSSRGSATRRHAVGAGFDYRLPKGATRSTLQYFHFQAERFIQTWGNEIELIVFNRFPMHEPADATEADIDGAFSAVLNAMPHSRRPLLSRFSRRDGFSYDAPTHGPERVRLYFEEQAKAFIDDWAGEVDRLGPSQRQGDRKSTVTTRMIDQALRATVNLTLLRRDEKVKGGGKRAPVRSRFQFEVRALAQEWGVEIIALLGGSAAAWTAAQDQLQDSSRFGSALALGAAGVVMVLLKRRGPWGR